MNRIRATYLTIFTIIFFTLDGYCQYIPRKNGKFLLTKTNKKYSNGDVFETKHYYDYNKNLTLLGENFKKFNNNCSSQGIPYNDNNYHSNTYYQYDSDNKLKSINSLILFEKDPFKRTISSDSTFRSLNFFYHTSNIRIEGLFDEISNGLIFKENKKVTKCYFFLDKNHIDEFIYKNDSKYSVKNFVTDRELDFGDLTFKNGEASLDKQIKEIIKSSELQSTKNYYYNLNKNLTKIEFLTDTSIYKTLRFFYSKVPNNENEQIIDIPTIENNMGKFLPDSVMYETKTRETSTSIKNGVLITKDTTNVKVETDIFEYTFDKELNLIKEVRYRKLKSQDIFDLSFTAAFNRGGIESDTTYYYYEKSK